MKAHPIEDDNSPGSTDLGERVWHVYDRDPQRDETTLWVVIAEGDRVREIISADGSRTVDAGSSKGLQIRDVIARRLTELSEG